MSAKGRGDGESDGLTDLEKELTCSICTDVLYQPLTLLDCLHTFCGYCLREWFAWQAHNASSAWPFTCPSCRAHVRETRPNATVTTLLELLLKAHPERLKPQQERDDIAKSYTPGDNVLIPAASGHESDDSEDQRVLEEARLLSLEDGQARRRPEHRSHERSAQGRTSETNRRHHSAAHGQAVESEQERDRRRRRAERRRQRGAPDLDTDIIRVQQHSRLLTQGRPLGHQSSLRSILSASSIDSEDMQEDIRRQIIDEGLLDGVDLNNLTREQEEEITERIALAFQRRQRERLPNPRSRRAPSRSPRQSSEQAPRSRDNTASSRQRSEAQHNQRATMQDSQTLRVSSDSDARSTSQQERRSDQRPTHAVPPPSTSTIHPISRSATDMLSTSPGSRIHSQQGHASHNRRRSTDPAGRRTASSGPQSSAEPNEPRRLPVSRFTATASARSSTSPAGSRERPSSRRARLPSSQNGADQTALQNVQHISQAQNTIISSPTGDNEVQSGRMMSRHNQVAASPMTPPSISCSRCQRPDIQTSLHYRCTKCETGHYYVCRQCYRSGRGCHHWFGFGYAAEYRFARVDHSISVNPPHVLSAQRYEAPGALLRGQINASDVRDGADSHPVVEQGLFCDACLEPANICYWHCDICNDGAWGFCQACVQKGRHCTHALEAMALKHLISTELSWHHDSTRSRPTDTTTPPPDANPSLLKVVDSPSLLPKRQKRLPHVPDPDNYAALVLPCDCDICHRSIPASAPRFHCPICPAGEGDYDICTSCYNMMAATGKISGIDGPDGWRRCPRGHRMLVIGYEEHDGGLRRIILRDLVGGQALKEDVMGSDNGIVHSTDGSGPADSSTEPHTAQSVVTNAAGGAKAGHWRWRDSDGTLHTTTAPEPITTAIPQQQSHPPSSQPLSPVSNPSTRISRASFVSRTSPVSPLSNVSAAQPPNLQAQSQPQAQQQQQQQQQQALLPLPPDGGVGLRVRALWSYFPVDGVTDELAFPRGAEIREAENINEDWFWGVYAGRKGLFPGNHGRVVGGAGSGGA